ncbi:hydroxyacylglutathione hydrolase [Coralloluteibacterium stylophorae]|uniref:Hydroxyacylglutathione hydrolase n=1 Tax=Coralloluteibacterium stylophorae TaxID=1776034 RepID=A0A8J7VTX8_9GAMM|nr:hydroxyacylglutathione hydrolase [Coralloluteibacterium stylophorae]MBS7457660.1 hydroxyacylglutathione hydrolase [Coralloluteibacterium stylophorae]
MHLRALPALSDNYIWTLSATDGAAVVVDPGEAGPVLAAMAQGLRPVAILLTHHHGDHIGGVAGILGHADVPCIGPADPRVAPVTRRVGNGDEVEVPELGLRFQVIEVPGHTSSHIAFHGGDWLFCGDTMFSLGCGRLFEGSAAQMLASLDRLSRLPPRTLVCAAHEYSQSNARFARTVDPDNPRLAQRADEIDALRAAGRPTLPSLLGDEMACNPFLRPDAPALVDAVERRCGRRIDGREAVFGALRAWKDEFR